MDKHDFNKESLELHKKHRGKIEVVSKIEVNTTDDLSRVYSPGVAAPCLAIAENVEEAYNLTIKGNTIAVVSDGTAVLGLGNIGPEAAIPVMEGKAMLFKKFANVDAFPICLNTTVSSEIIETVKRIAPVFGGVNLEDISAPRSFEIETALQDIGIPVFHDDQHGTAIVALAGILNSCGIIHKNRTDLNPVKIELLDYSNPDNVQGSLKDAIVNADVFIGVSVANILTADDIKTMAQDPVIFALANPNPEIMPEEALKGGAAIIATGRSDYPNQVNNVLAFPGIFRGALDCRAKRITPKMKIAAAYAIASCLSEPDKENIIPKSLNKQIASKVAEAVKQAYDNYEN